MKGRKVSRKKKKRSNKVQLTVMSVVLVVLIIIALFVYKGTRGSDNQAKNQETLQEGSKVSQIEFPYSIDEGKLEIESLFQFDGINPDSENEEGTDIASIMIKNVSNSHLVRADIEVMPIDGEAVKFVVTELPAGESAMAFSVENLSVTEGTAYESISCEAVYEESKTSEEIPVTTSIEDSIITLKNTTEEEISQLTIYYREPFDDAYFGGIAKECVVENISANESVDVKAEDSILGVIEIVRLSLDR